MAKRVLSGLQCARKADKCFALDFHHSYFWPFTTMLSHFKPFNAVFGHFKPIFATWHDIKYYMPAKKQPCLTQPLPHSTDLFSIVLKTSMQLPTARTAGDSDLSGRHGQCG